MLREKLAKALNRLTESFAHAIGEAQERSQIRRDMTSDELAVIVLSAWHGVLLRAKVEQRGDAAALIARSVPLLLQVG